MHPYHPSDQLKETLNRRYACSHTVTPCGHAALHILHCLVTALSVFHLDISTNSDAFSKYLTYDYSSSVDYFNAALRVTQPTSQPQHASTDFHLMKSDSNT